MAIKKELLRSLNLFTVLLGNILLPQDSNLALHREIALLSDVLDHLGAPCCVIDGTTEDIVYANEPARANGCPTTGTPGVRKLCLHEHTEDGHELWMLLQANEKALASL